jgi:hypothetical protein
MVFQIENAPIHFIRAYADARHPLSAEILPLRAYVPVRGDTLARKAGGRARATTNIITS